MQASPPTIEGALQLQQPEARQPLTQRSHSPPPASLAIHHQVQLPLQPQGGGGGGGGGGCTQGVLVSPQTVPSPAGSSQGQQALQVFSFSDQPNPPPKVGSHSQVQPPLHGAVVEVQSQVVVEVVVLVVVVVLVHSTGL